MNYQRPTIASTAKTRPPHPISFSPPMDHTARRDCPVTKSVPSRNNLARSHNYLSYLPTEIVWLIWDLAGHASLGAACTVSLVCREAHKRMIPHIYATATVDMLSRDIIISPIYHYREHVRHLMIRNRFSFPALIPKGYSPARASTTRPENAFPSTVEFAIDELSMLDVSLWRSPLGGLTPPIRSLTIFEWYITPGIHWPMQRRLALVHVTHLHIAHIPDWSLGTNPQDWLLHLPQLGHLAIPSLRWNRKKKAFSHAPLLIQENIKQFRQYFTHSQLKMLVLKIEYDIWKKDAGDWAPMARTRFINLLRNLKMVDERMYCVYWPHHDPEVGTTWSESVRGGRATIWDKAIHTRAKALAS
jgi:hypothetical protein